MKLIKTRILKWIRIFLMIFSSFQYFYGMKEKSSNEWSKIDNNSQEDENNKQEHKNDGEININLYQYSPGDVNSQYDVNPQDQKNYDQKSNKKYICNYCYYCCCCR